MDLTSILGSFAALIFVLALVMLVSIILRKYANSSGIKVKSGGAKRLKIVQATPIDARRRLVLIRRDNVEHLLCLSNDGDMIIESGIEIPDEVLRNEKAEIEK